MNITKHFVEFYSPGTFVAEVTSKPIDSWDVQEAVKMADNITERYNATPYGFRFVKRTRGPTDLDSKQSDTSPMYYLGGDVLTLEQVAARSDPADRILLANMRSNDWKRIVVNTNSWKCTQPLLDGDIVLDFTPKQKDAA